MESKNQSLSLKTEIQSTEVASVARVDFMAYNELSERPVQSEDHLQRLHANIALLEELQGRLSFISKEIRYHIRK